MERKKIVTDENDIYLYFEMIKQLKPLSVLDVGMFLKRIGAVARQAMDCEVPMQVRLDGLDLFPQMQVPVYRGIYNEIYMIDDVERKIRSRHYDVTMLLRVNEWLVGEERQRLWECFMRHTRCIIADTDDTEFVKFVLQHGRCEPLNLEDRQYVAVWCGADSQEL